MRCQDTYCHRGVYLHCEGDQGHSSAHWNGEVWWGNDEGFPEHLPKIRWWARRADAEKFWLALAAVGAIIFTALVWWLFQ